MPQMPPNPPRSGHPGKPPQREDSEDTNEEMTSSRGPHSYGQSAPMPDDDSSATVVRQVHQQNQPQDPSDEDPRDTLEDLAGEPIREEGEDEPS